MPRPRHSGTFASREAGPLRGEVSPPRCATLWIGEGLGAVERACMRSVLRQGHRLDLYCYREVAGIPEGVEVRDANAVIPESEIFFQRNGSVAAFSDWFRYEIQRRDAGTWLDADVYLLRPLDADADYLFGEEEPGIINNAVLRLPPESPLLEPLLEVFQKRITPPWLDWRPYASSRAREFFSGHADFTRLPWGATGPMAVTRTAKELGLAAQAQPMEVFNPVPWSKADWIIDPGTSLSDVTTERTVALHLWNYCIASYKNLPAPPGSFLQRLQQEGALTAS